MWESFILLPSQDRLKMCLSCKRCSLSDFLVNLITMINDTYLLLEVLLGGKRKRCFCYFWGCWNKLSVSVMSGVLEPALLYLVKYSQVHLCTWSAEVEGRKEAVLCPVATCTFPVLVRTKKCPFKTEYQIEKQGEIVLIAVESVLYSR